MLSQNFPLPDSFVSVPFEQLTGYGSLVLIAILVITRKLVWHKDLAKETERANRWEAIALDAMATTEKFTVSAELANQLLENMKEDSSSEVQVKKWRRYLR